MIDWHGNLIAYHWLIKIASVLIVSLIITWIEYIAYRRWAPYFQSKQKLLQFAFIKSFHRPFIVLLWLISGSLIVQMIASQLGMNGNFTQAISLVRLIITILIILWFAMRYIRGLENHYIVSLSDNVSRFRDKTSINALSQVARIVIIIIAVLVLMQTVGIKITTILAFGGISGLAISFAAKDTLANFLGGMMIYWDRPFSVGDWVRSPDRSIEGTVENIGWRLTRIRTFDKRPLYVPNGIFSNVSIENPSRMTNRRIKTIVGIRYDDATKVATIVQEIKQMLQQHPDIDQQQTLIVNLVEFGPSSLNILIYTFTKTTNWIKFQQVQENVFVKIIDIISQQKAEFAFPTTTVHIPDGIENKNSNLRQGYNNE